MTDEEKIQAWIDATIARGWTYEGLPPKNELYPESEPSGHWFTKGHVATGFGDGAINNQEQMYGESSESGVEWWMSIIDLYEDRIADGPEH